MSQPASTIFRGTSSAPRVLSLHFASFGVDCLTSEVSASQLRVLTRHGLFGPVFEKIILIFGKTGRILMEHREGFFSNVIIYNFCMYVSFK